MQPRPTHLAAPLLLLIALVTSCCAAPTDAGIPSLEKDLLAGQFPTRVRAARILGYIGGQGQAKALAEMALSDRAREPRIVAAHALAQLGSARYAPVVNARLQTELNAPPASSVTSAAGRSHRAAVLALVESLAVLDPESCAAKMAACLSHDDPAIRLGAIRALGRTSDPEATALLVRAAETGSAEERLAAAGALGLCSADTTSAAAVLIARTVDAPQIAEALVPALLGGGDRASVPALIACLRHPLPEVRASAARILGLFGVTSAAPELTRACADSSVPVRSAALLALASIAPNAAEKAAHEALSSKAPTEREFAVRALGLIPAASAAEALMTLARGDESALVPIAVRALAGRSAPSLSALLVRLAGSKVAETRRAAVEALAWRGDPGAEDVLLRVLADARAPEPVWRAASVGLARGSNQPPVARLSEIACSENGRVAGRGISTLGLCGTGAAADAVSRLRPETEDACLGRVDALATLPGSAAKSALLGALEDPRPAVRKLVARALLERGPGALASLLPLAETAPAELALAATVDESLREAVAAGWLMRARLDAADRSALNVWLQRSTASHGRLEGCAATIRAALGHADAIRDVHGLLLGAPVDAQLRQETCEALGDAGCAGAAPLVRAYLGVLLSPGSPTWAAGPRRTHLLAAGIHAAGQLRDTDAIGLLYNGFGEAPGIRAETLRALASIAPEASRDLLRRGCRDESPTVRAVACRLLSDCAVPSDAPWLLGALVDGTTEDLRSWVVSLDAWAPDAVIAGFLAHGDRAVALGAATALARRISQGGNTDAALALLNRELAWNSLFPEDAPEREALARVYRAIGEMCVDSGDPSQALGWLRRAHMTDSSPAGLAQTAVCYGRAGNTEAARTLGARAAWEELTGE